MKTEHGRLGPTENYRTTVYSYKNNDITNIKARRIEWLGHVSRIKTNRMFKVILDLRMGSKRGTTRPN